MKLNYDVIRDDDVLGLSFDDFEATVWVTSDHVWGRERGLWSREQPEYLGTQQEYYAFTDDPWMSEHFMFFVLSRYEVEAVFDYHQVLRVDGEVIEENLQPGSIMQPFEVPEDEISHDGYLEAGEHYIASDFFDDYSIATFGDDCFIYFKIDD